MGSFLLTVWVVDLMTRNVMLIEHSQEVTEVSCSVAGESRVQEIRTNLKNSALQQEELVLVFFDCELQVLGNDNGQ